MKSNFSILKEEGVAICAQSMDVNIFPSGTQIYKREHK